MIPLPPGMAVLVARQDAADQNQAEVAEYAREDDAVMRVRVREHQSHAFEAATGYPEHEWLAAQQAVQFAKGDLGWDANAPLGSPQHPEPLVAGESVCRPAAPGTARRSGASEAEELARRVAFEAEAGREVISRAKTISRRRQIAELERELAAGRDVPGPATSTAGGRVIARSFAAGDGWVPPPPLPAAAPFVPRPAARSGGRARLRRLCLRGATTDDVGAGEPAGSRLPQAGPPRGKRLGGGPPRHRFPHPRRACLRLRAGSGRRCSPHRGQ